MDLITRRNSWLANYISKIIQILTVHSYKETDKARRKQARLRAENIIRAKQFEAKFPDNKA